MFLHDCHDSSEPVGCALHGSFLVGHSLPLLLQLKLASALTGAHAPELLAPPLWQMNRRRRRSRSPTPR
ncbi:hypothetical protein UPYG_G00127580 [Umbra pygmaea]|uniref:Uncharacterized protein n=1 Tax=Umbra pygmaea TaxID=75934 RepID=A0ABD0XTU9_UMBPY